MKRPLVPLAFMVVAAGFPLPVNGAETAEIEARAAAYQHGTMEALGLDPSDGIDADEARKIGDWHILGIVALNKNAAKIVSYSGPVSDGANWRFDVVQDESFNDARRGALFVNKLSGRQYGPGWGNYSGGPWVDVGAATYWVNDQSQPILTVTLKRLTHSGDAGARVELAECVERIRERVNRANPLVEPIVPADIRFAEGRAIVEFAKPNDPDRKWSAEIVLRRKP